MRTLTTLKQRIVGACVVAAAIAVLPVGGAPALAAGAHAPVRDPGEVIVTRGDTRCVIYNGIDLNEVLGVSERIVRQPWCYQVNAGEWYIPLWGWFGATSYANVPSPYPLAGATPLEDFLAKLVAVRYVVDPGTPKERSYRFDGRDIPRVIGTTDQIEAGPIAAVVHFVAKLPPLSPGVHRFQTFVELSAAHCDGLGTAPENCAPPGETFVFGCPFAVIDGASQFHE